jgi:uncharacterized small protein (DUF1192 family)
MDLDELLPKKAKGPLAELCAEDLDRLSVHELEARVAALEAEVTRTKNRLGSAGSRRAAADALFKKS